LGCLEDYSTGVNNVRERSRGDRILGLTCLFAVILREASGVSPRPSEGIAGPFQTRAGTRKVWLRVSYYWGRLWFRSCCPCQVPYQVFPLGGHFMAPQRVF